ncbi:MAG: glycosyltransferase family 2 protein [Victivallales bacterium]|jgi:glycosyltransferase involved in cell wall biosynthesis
MNSEKILSVVIPVYNEAKTINVILDEVLARPETAEIIVVDDASKDNSKELIQKYVDRGDGRVRLVCQEVNHGKGAAIRRGFDEAKAPIVIIQDADNEYSPEDYPVIIAPIISGKADVVYGSRFQGAAGRVLYYKHRLGNKVLTSFSNLLTDINLTDMETCYKAFKREVIQNINLDSERFGIEVEMTAKFAHARVLRIYEVPISYNGRTYEEGKKITWKDGVAAIWHMIKYNILLNKSRFYKKPWNEVMK